jgi:DNA (cytosine-5)-methyltransferase 1
VSVVDLFCGAGGFSLGFQAAGCEILSAVDVDETAARTFEQKIWISIGSSSAAVPISS